MSIVTSALSSLVGKDKQKAAQEDIEKGIKKSEGYLGEAYATQQREFAPWRTYGGGALERLGGYYGLGHLAPQVQYQTMMPEFQGVRPKTEAEIRDWAASVGGINKKGKVRDWARDAAQYSDYYDWAKSQGGVTNSGRMRGWAKDYAQSQLDQLAQLASQPQQQYAVGGAMPQAQFSNQQAMAWAQANPNDPRAARIQQMIGGM